MKLTREIVGRLAVSCLFLCSSFSLMAQKQIPLEDVAKNINQTVTVCGKVYGVSLLKNVKGKPTLMNLGGSHPKERITIRIRFENRSSFTLDPELLFLHKNICFEGTIHKKNGYPEIEIDTSKSNKLITDALIAVADSSEPNVLVKRKETPKKVDTIQLASNAYVLAGPNLDEPIITFLKGSSIVRVNYSVKGWSYVRVIQNVTKPGEQKWLCGFVRNEALGLDKNGEVKKKKSLKELLSHTLVRAETDIESR